MLYSRHVTLGTLEDIYAWRQFSRLSCIASLGIACIGVAVDALLTLLHAS